MAFTRVNPSGWSTGDRLTATQANDLDTNVSRTIDRRTTGLDIDSRTGVIRHYANGYASSSSASVFGNSWATPSASVMTLFFPLDSPHGATITAVSGWYTAAGAHGAMPATMPIVRLTRFIGSSGATTTVASQTDTTATTGPFETRHEIALTGLSYVVDRTTETPLVLFFSEGGANAVSGALMGGIIKVTYTIAAIDPAQ